MKKKEGADARSKTKPLAKKAGKKTKKETAKSKFVNRNEASKGSSEKSRY